MNQHRIPPRARLDDQVAVVTGGGRGIGRATAIRLAEAGARVVVTARTTSEIRETVEEIQSEGGTASALSADVSSWAAMSQLARETDRLFGVPDIVVANAGVVEPVAHAWEVEPNAWTRSLEINLVGVFYTVRAFLSEMVDRGRGVFIFTSSGAASHPIVGLSAYCAGKAGLDHFARTLAAEFHERDIGLRAHTFYPGVVDTAMQRRIRRKPAGKFPSAERYRGYHEDGILRSPDEPATLVWWLATPMAAAYAGRPVDLDDPWIRRRLARDLDMPRFGGRDS